MAKSKGNSAGSLGWRECGLSSLTWPWLISLGLGMQVCSALPHQGPQVKPAINTHTHTQGALAC